MILIFVSFQSVASYENILKRRALIVNDEIMMLDALSYESYLRITKATTKNKTSVVLAYSKD